MRLNQRRAGTLRYLVHSNHGLRGERIADRAVDLSCDVVLLRNWADGRLVLSVELLRAIHVLTLGERSQVHVTCAAFFATHHYHGVEVVGIVCLWPGLGVGARRDGSMAVRLMKVLPAVAHEAAAARCLLDPRGDVAIVVDRRIIFEILLQILLSVGGDVVSIMSGVALVVTEDLVAVVGVLAHDLVVLRWNLVKGV